MKHLGVNMSFKKPDPNRDNYTGSPVDRPFVPERDLFRLIKYGTYCLLDLDAYTPEFVPPGELTDEELRLVEIWYNEWAYEEE
jgi:hypothetical protein